MFTNLHCRSRARNRCDSSLPVTHTLYLDNDSQENECAVLCASPEGTVRYWPRALSPHNHVDFVCALNDNVVHSITRLQVRSERNRLVLFGVMQTDRFVLATTSGALHLIHIEHAAKGVSRRQV